MAWSTDRDNGGAVVTATGTVFPQAIGLATTWNPDLILQVGEAVGDEVRGYHALAPRVWGLQVWAPVVNLLRDPRVSVAVTDRDDGYRWIGFASTVRVVDDQPTAQADIAGMARRYHADDPGEADDLIRDRFERQTRISFRVPIRDVHEHLD